VQAYPYMRSLVNVHVYVYMTQLQAERKYTFMAMSYEYMMQWCMHHLVALIKLI